MDTHLYNPRPDDSVDWQKHAGLENVNLMDFNALIKLPPEVVEAEEMPHMENVTHTVTVEDVGDRKMVTYSIEGDIFMTPPQGKAPGAREARDHMRKTGRR